jgi:hypothetical protein
MASIQRFGVSIERADRVGALPGSAGLGKTRV